MQGLDLSHYITHLGDGMHQSSWVLNFSINAIGYPQGLLMLKEGYGRDIALFSSLCTAHGLSYKNHENSWTGQKRSVTVQAVNRTKKSHPGCKKLWINANAKSMTCVWAALKHFAEAAELEANLSKTQMVADQVLQMKLTKTVASNWFPAGSFPMT